MSSDSRQDRNIKFLFSLPSHNLVITFTFASFLNQRLSKMSLDVVYSDVVFVKRNEVGSNDPDQSQLALQKTKPCGDFVRLLLTALCVLLTSGLVALSFQYVYTEKKLRDLQQLHSALNETFTGKYSYYTENMHRWQQKLSKALDDSACPKDWEYHAGKCYYFSSNSLDWTKSRDTCISDGGHLVIINLKDEQEFLMSIITMKHKEQFWIGLTDKKKEGQWLWVDNSELSLRYWFENEPDNWRVEYNTGEDCVIIRQAGLNSWSDAACSKSFRRICETRSSRQT
ncbi:immune-related, lectin-like receptor 4 [Rhinichthys klamathensis goyatoka]|uniref:immune-related, lectin-like receptor 4 n=1 Tax=Rhinichthys klamathensis goyatoka TaxID=3034132 RepID=UPI0024B55AF1|nr:immune-related, lectin-like receptor 4 [Rhinichthys klamathensis goyatoka]